MTNTFTAVCHERHQDFWVRGQQGEGHGGENCCYRTFNWGKLAAGALAVNDRKQKRNSTLTLQCFDTFRWFLHKLYAATMDGNGREGTYNFFLRRLGAARGRARHRAQGGSCPLSPRWRRPCSVYLLHYDDWAIIRCCRVGLTDTVLARRSFGWYLSGSLLVNIEKVSLPHKFVAL